MLFPGQEKDTGTKIMSLLDILHAINLDFQYSQMGKPPTRGEISLALDLLTPRKIEAIREQYGNKLYYELSKYMSTDVNMINNERISEIIQFVQGKLIDRTDLLALNDGSISLAGNLVLEATADMLDTIISKQNVLQLPSAYGNGSYKVRNGIVLDNKLTVAHLVVMLAEKGDERIDERRLAKLAGMHGLSALKNSNGRSVLDMIESVAVKWKDKNLIEDVKRARADTDASYGLGDRLARIKEKHGEKMAKLVESFSDDAVTQGKLIDKLLG